MEEEKKVYYIFSTPPNNHGCVGFQLEITASSPTEGVVTNGHSCSSCWQVGHDDPSPVLEIGTKVGLPKGQTWESASKKAGFSHNELVDDRDDPQPDCSVIEPLELVILS